MTNQSLARSYLIKAQKRLKALAVLRDEGSERFKISRPARRVIRSSAPSVSSMAAPSRSVRTSSSSTASPGKGSVDGQVC